MRGRRGCESEVRRSSQKFDFSQKSNFSSLLFQQFTLAAIDDVIGRGKRRDWAELRRVALNDRAVMEKVLRVCQAHITDPYAQRYHFWKQYAERYLA